MKAYFTVVIPWVPDSYRTQWHPTTQLGPFSTLCRGAFENIGKAIEWARENLGGAPYSIRMVDICPLCGEDREHPSQHGSHECTRR